MKVTVFEGFNLNRGDHDLITILEGIRRGRWEKTVREIREMKSAGDNERADRLKRALPAFTLSATYRGARKSENITGYNGLIMLDVDKLDPVKLVDVIRKAVQCPYTAFCFSSPSGQGVKIGVNPLAAGEVPLVAHPLTVENHKATFQACLDFYEKLSGAVVDPSGKDPGRLCFVSFDPELFINERGIKFREGSESPEDPEVPEAPEAPEVPKAPKTPEAPEPPATAKKNAPAKPSPETVAALKRARHRTSAQCRYEEGNRNNYVFRFACNCRKAKIAWDDVLVYCSDRFRDLPDEEIRTALESAFNTVEKEEAADDRAGKRCRDVMIARTEEWLSKNFKLRFNVISRSVEYRQRQSRKAFIPLNDQAENSIWRALQHEGISIRLSTLHTILMSDFCPRFDPFREYFEKLPAWNGQDDAIRRLADTVEVDNPELWYRALRRFLVAMVASTLDPQVVNHTVLVLASDQGKGKTTWCLNLLPPELHDYRYSGIPDSRSKDSIDLLSRCILINLDELGILSMKELNALKEMITKSVIHIRPVYARNTEHFPRIASFIASVNTSQVFRDTTGSRRFANFLAHRIDYEAPVDYAALYSQVMHLYRSGFRFWLDEEDIREINANNEAFRIRSPEEELLNTWIYPPKPGEKHQIKCLTATDILGVISGRTPMNLPPKSAVQVGLILKKEGFESFYRGNKRLYKVVVRTVDEVDALSKENEDDAKKTKQNTDSEPDLFQ